MRACIAEYEHRLDTQAAIGRALAMLFALAGCGSNPAAPPGGEAGEDGFAEDIELVLADLEPADADVRYPYKASLTNADDEAIGSLFMSSCGCGNLQALAELDGGRFLATIVFPNFPIALDDFHASEEDQVQITGLFYGTNRRARGELTRGRTVSRFDAVTDEQAPATEGCVLCHVGDDPPRPLPDTHIAVTVETNCLECHSAALR